MKGPKGAGGGRRDPPLSKERLTLRSRQEPTEPRRPCSSSCTAALTTPATASRPPPPNGRRQPQIKVHTYVNLKASVMASRRSSFAAQGDRPNRGPLTYTGDVWLQTYPWLWLQ